MAKGFNLTAQINLKGPNNLKPIVADIKRQLGTITSDINLKISPQASKSIDIVTKRLGAMNSALLLAKNSANDLNATLGSLSSSLSTISSIGSKTSVSINATAKSSQVAAQSIKSAATEMEAFGKQSALAIRRFAAFSVVSSAIYGLVNAINSGFKAFINFDRELIKLQQVTNKGATGIALLEKTITSLATNLGVSSESLIAVASTLAQAGLSADDTRIALAALAKTELAPSFDNLTDTTEGAIAALRQFELQAGELESALGSINAVAAAFAVESKDIISAIQRTGGVFAAASKGVSQGTDALNEFIAIFTSVRQTTRESAETIATGLRTIFTRIQRARTIDQLKDFGIVLTDLEGKFVGPYEAIKRLSEGLRTLDPRDLRFSQIVEELGGFRQIGKVIPLIQQFAVAQEALKVAQKGQGSLTEAQIIAQKSLANQIAKVREQFLALIRDIGKSSVFQGLFKLVTSLTSGLISLAGAFKPILPILAIMGTIKGIKAVGEFGSGFFGGLKSSAGGSAAKNVGSNIGSTLSGSKDQEKTAITKLATDAVTSNTSALKSLTNAVSSLESVIKSRGSSTLSSGGKVLGFNSGGMVPGNGGGDKIPALLEGGEIVMNRKAVKEYGASNLLKMNSGSKGKGVKTPTGARSKFKELSSSEIEKLSTPELIAYGRALANDIFSTRGAGIAVANDFIEVPMSRITPELEPYLQNYLGKKGFWKERIAPFGKPLKAQSAKQSKLDRASALQKQVSKQADEVFARSQQWSSISSGSDIDQYLLSSLKDPILSDYKNVRGGGSLAVPYHNTRLRQAVNKALDNYDDFDYSASNIDKLVSSMAAEKFASGGLIQKFAQKQPKLNSGLVKEATEKGSFENLIKSNMIQDDIYNFGLVALRSGTKQGTRIVEDRPIGETGKKARIHVGVLSDQQQYDNIEKDIVNSLRQTISKTGKSLAGSLGVPTISGSEKKQILSGAVLSSATGSIFEAALQTIGAPYIDKIESIKSMDFPFGLGAAAKLFGQFPSNIPTDATRTVGGSGKGISDFVGQIDRFIKSVDKNKFTKELGSPLGTPANQMAASLVSKIQTEEQRQKVNNILTKFGIPNFTRKRRAKFESILSKRLTPEAIKELESQNFAEGGLADATSQMTDLMNGLYNRQSKTSQTNKKQKNFGKIGLRNSGSEITATYFKNAEREGFVSAKKSSGNLYTIGLSKASKGYGPRLYDIVMEAATSAGGMLASDRNQVSDAAQAVWAYYFNNRSDVKKTPLDPSQWTKNQSYIDPKLYGKKETWPPPNDPAWILQSGYSKNPELIKSSDIIDMNDPKYAKFIQMQQSSFLSRSTGGVINNFASGGTVPAMVSAGEAFVPPKLAKKIGYSNLNKMNQADRNGMKSFAGGGGISVFKGPGSGTSDSIGPIGLPEGSFIIREKATKAIGLNKGGIVGSLKRFFRGGIAEQQTERAQGTLISDVKQAEKTFAMIMGQLGKGIRSSILNNFKGIESIGAGQKTSLGSKFSENTRGQAAFKRDSTVMGLQIKGKKVGATTETVAHEAGHLADYSLGGKKGFASQTEGTFQFQLVEKIKPIMEKAFIKAGKSSSEISNYLIKNEELFAEFFAKASPGVRAIITSTTDAEAGMKALSDHLGDVGYTFAGLEASDIADAFSSLKKSINAAGASVSAMVGVGGGGVSGGGGGGGPVTPSGPSGPGGGGDRWPSNMMSLTTSGKAANALQVAAEQAEFFAYKAKEAGQSVNQFSKTLATKVVSRSQDLESNLKNKQTGLRYNVLGKADELKGVKDKSIIDAAIQDFAAQLKEIDPSKSADQINKAAVAIVKGLKDGLSLENIISSSKDLEEVFKKTYKAGEALEEALKQVAKEAGLSAEALQRGVGPDKLRQEQFIQSDAGKSFGNLAKLIPDKLEKLSKTGLGKGLSGLGNVLSGKGLSERLEKSFGRFGGLLGDKINALGGPMVVLGSGMSILGEKLPQILGAKYATSETAATVAGGLGGAGQGLASGALLGGQLAGPIGAMIGGISGAIIGGITGAFEALNQKKLENNLKALEKTSGDVAAALEKLAISASKENIQNTQSALEADLQAIEKIGQQAQLGSGGSARGWVEFLRNIPGVGAITGANQENEARQAVFAGNERAFNAASRLGDINRSGAPIQQMQDLLDRANKAAEAAGGADTEAGRKAREKARNEVLAQGSQTYQQLRMSGGKSDAIYRAAGVEQARKQGRDVSKEMQTPEGIANLIEEGKRYLAIQEESALKQEILSDAMRNVLVQSDNLVDMYRRVQSSLERFGQGIDDIKNKAIGAANAMRGRAIVQNVDRKDEQVLSNLSAYSIEEVGAVAERVSGMAGGTPRAKDLGNQIKASKLITDELPRLLKGATAENIGNEGGVIQQLNEIFKTAKIEVPPGLLTGIEESLSQKLAGRTESSTGDLAEELDIVGLVSKSTSEALKTAQAFLKQYNDALQAVTDLTKEYADVLNEANEWTLRAADIRSRADIQLAETLGKNLTLSQKNKPQEDRILGLTTGIQAGGTTDPQKIYQGMQTAVSQLGDARERTGLYGQRAALTDAMAANPNDAKVQEAYLANEKAIATQTNTVNNARKALEELANDGTAAANALQAIQEQQKVAGASVNFLQKVLTSDAAELDKMNKGLAAYTKIISGKATKGDINSLQFRQQAFGGLQELQGLLPDSIFNQMQARMSEAMIDAMPGGKEMLDRGTGALYTDPETGKTTEMTYRRAIQLKAQGKDPQQERLAQIYNQAADKQQLAATMLAKAATDAAAIIEKAQGQTLEETNQKTPTILEEAAQNSAAIVTPPTEKPRDGTLVRTEAQLDAASTGKPELSFGFESVNTSMTDLAKSVAVVIAALGAFALALKAFSSGGGGGGGGISGTINSVIDVVDTVRDLIPGRKRGGFGGGAPRTGSRQARASKQAAAERYGTRGTIADAGQKKPTLSERKTTAAEYLEERKNRPRSSVSAQKPASTGTGFDTTSGTMGRQARTTAATTVMPDVGVESGVAPTTTPKPADIATTTGKVTPPTAKGPKPKGMFSGFFGRLLNKVSSVDDALTVAGSVSNIASGKGTVQDVVYGTQSALEIGADNAGLLSRIPGAAQVGKAVGGAGQALNLGKSPLLAQGGATAGAANFLALNTAISAFSNAIEFASDPKAYTEKMENKANPEMDSIRGRSWFGFIGDSLGGALEGLQDPIGKIVESGYVAKGLWTDVSNAISTVDKSKRLDEQMNQTIKETRGAKGEALSKLDPLEQSRAMEEAQTRLMLKKAQEVKTGGGSLEDLGKMFDYENMGESFGVKNIDEFIAQKQKQLTALPEDRVQSRKSSKRGTWDWSSNTDPKGFSEAVQQEMEFRESQLGKPLSAMEQMANEATKPGSIFTHDIHLEKILEKLVASSGPAGAMGSAVADSFKPENLTKAFEKAKETAIDTKDKAKSFISSGLKAVTDPKTLAEGAKKTISTLFNPKEALLSAKGAITKLLPQASDKKLKMQGDMAISDEKLKVTDLAKPETSTESCECKILTEILAELKKYYDQQKTVTPTTNEIVQPIPAPEPPSKPLIQEQPAPKTSTVEEIKAATKAEGIIAPAPKELSKRDFKAEKAVQFKKLRELNIKAQKNKLSMEGFGEMNKTNVELSKIREEEAAAKKAEKTQRREDYLLKQNPKTRQRLMTKAEKESGLAEKLAEKEAEQLALKEIASMPGARRRPEGISDADLVRQQVKQIQTNSGGPLPAIAQPVPSNIPKPVEYTRQIQSAENIKPSDQDKKVSTNNPNTVITVDPSAQVFLDGLNTAFKGFDAYISRLESVASTIPSKIELTGNYQLQVQITGAAALEGLDKRMKELAVSLIEPKLEQLRNEVSSATGGAVKPSASMGKKGE